MKYGKVALRRFSLISKPLKKERHVWALLLYFMGIKDSKEATAFLKYWRLSNQLITDSVKLLELILYRHHYPLNHYIVYTYTPPLIWEAEDLLQMLNLPFDKRTAARLILTLPIQSREELAVNGRIIMEETDSRGGPWLGEAIQVAEKAVVLGAVENKTGPILNWLKENKYI